MKIPFFDLHRQYQALKPVLDPAVMDCLSSCQYIMGPQEKEFERTLSEYLDAGFSIGCGNGTDALKIALRAVGVQPGDEVITTPFTFYATAEAIAAVGGVPVFADVKEDDYCIDPAKIEPLITEQTRAILPVHIFGSPADLAPILGIAKKHNLKVVDDACQAIGARYQGKPIGALTDATCFSFYPTKNLGCCGDGGMVVTNNEAIANNCRALQAHGSGKAGAAAYACLQNMAADVADDFNDVQQPQNSLYDPFKYYNYLIAENSRLDSIQASILLAKLPYLHSLNARRAAIAQQYIQGLKDMPVSLPHMAAVDSFHCWHQFALMSEDRDALTNHLSEHGIGTGAFYPVPLHLQKALRYLGYHEGDMPVAESLCKRSVCLPIFPEITDDEVAYITDVIRAFFQKN